MLRRLVLILQLLWPVLLTAQPVVPASVSPGDNDTLPRPPKNKTNWIIGLGDRKPCNGLRLSLVNDGSRTNGINLALWTSTQYSPPQDFYTTNGIDFGILAANEYKVNGLSYGTFAASADHLNGLAFGGLGGEVDDMNGVALMGLLFFGDVNNGVVLTGLDYTTSMHRGIAFAGALVRIDSTFSGIGLSSVCYYADGFTNGLTIAPFNFTAQMNGLQIGGLNHSKKLYGVSLGLINHIDDLNGVSFGLLNTVVENPRWCRTLPLLNMNFKKYADPRIDTIRCDSGTCTVVKRDIRRDTISITQYRNGKKNGVEKTFRDRHHHYWESKTYRNDTLNGWYDLFINHNRRFEAHTCYVNGVATYRRSVNAPWPGKNIVLISEEAEMHDTMKIFPRQSPVPVREGKPSRSRSYSIINGDTLNRILYGFAEGPWLDEPSYPQVLRTARFHHDTLDATYARYTGKSRRFRSPYFGTITLNQDDTLYCWKKENGAYTQSQRIDFWTAMELDFDEAEQHKWDIARLKPIPAGQRRIYLSDNHVYQISWNDGTSVRDSFFYHNGNIKSISNGAHQEQWRRNGACKRSITLSSVKDFRRKGSLYYAGYCNDSTNNQISLTVPLYQLKPDREKVFYKNGQPAGERYWTRGNNRQIISSQTWYENGVLRSKEEGGQFSIWWENGTLRLEQTARRHYRTWYENGQLHEQVGDTVACVFRQDGTLEHKYVYHPGDDWVTDVYAYRKDGTLKTRCHNFGDTLYVYNQSGLLLRVKPGKEEHDRPDDFREEDFDYTYRNYRESPVDYPRQGFITFETEERK